MIVDNAKYESAINAPSNSVNIAAPDQAFTLAVAAPELGKSHSFNFSITVYVFDRSPG